MDCVHDQLALGKKLRILTVADTHSRFYPAADPGFGHRGEWLGAKPRLDGERRRFRN
jgi:hypothetical protein